MPTTSLDSWVDTASSMPVRRLTPAVCIRGALPL
jgi:hypothetical protein